MKLALTRIASCVLSLAVLGAAQESRGGLKEAEFQKLHKELQISTKGVYAIPWRLSLHDARTEAAQSGKPVFMWMQDGHPLGIT